MAKQNKKEKQSNSLQAKFLTNKQLTITGIDDTATTAVVQRGVDNGVPMVLMMAILLGVVQTTFIVSNHNHIKG